MKRWSVQDSDLDLTCVIPGKSVEYALEIFDENRKVVMSTLESAPGIEVLQEIWTARVPVVKMKFAGFLEVGKCGWDGEMPCPTSTSRFHSSKSFQVLSIKPLCLSFAILLWSLLKLAIFFSEKSLIDLCVHLVLSQVDLTFQNTAALVNTELLKAYSKMCPQLRELGIAVKRWAKAVPLATTLQRNHQVVGSCVKK